MIMHVALQVKRWITAALSIAKRIPLTLVLLAVVIVFGLSTGAIWTNSHANLLSAQYGYGLQSLRDGHIANLILGMVALPKAWMYIQLLPLMVLVWGYLEYRYGALKMLITTLGTHVFAVLLVAGLLALFEPYHFHWVGQLVSSSDIGFSNAIFGAIGVVSAGLSPLWRRRVRFGVTLYCIAFVLFSAVIWDFTHFAGFLVGLAIGPLIIGRPYQLSWQKISIGEARNLIASIIVFNALTDFVNYLFPGNGGILNIQSDGRHQSVTFGITISFVLLLFAYGIAHGRKVAWRIVTTITVLGTLLDWLMVVLSYRLGLGIGTVLIFEAAISTTLLALLIIFRNAFTVKPNKGSKRRIYLRVLFVSFGIWLINASIMYAMRSQFTPKPTFAKALLESFAQLFGIRGQVVAATSGFANGYTHVVAFSWLMFILGSLAFLIISTYRSTTKHDSFAAYDALLHKYGITSIGWMTRWPGMSYWLNSTNTVGIAYRLEQNTAIVLSDPIGIPATIAKAIPAFESFCRINGWHPAFYAVSDAMRKLLKKQGYSSMQVGEDTVIELPNLEFAGKAWQSVRSAVNRANKDGISMRVLTYATASIGIKDQLHTIAEGWANDKSLPEMGFTLGTLKEAEDPEVRLHIAVDETGTVHGMTSWMPIYRKGEIVGWTIDIMQRRLHDETMPGVMEFLIAESALAFKQEGYLLISLSAAPLSFGDNPKGSIEKLLSTLSVRLEPYYGFKSLDRFKQKFQPRREAMYLCYADPAQLPAIAIALGSAYMPDMSAISLLQSLKQ